VKRKRSAEKRREVELFMSFMENKKAVFFKSYMWMGKYGFRGKDKNIKKISGQRNKMH
jgi:hypothetical protein